MNYSEYLLSKLQELKKQLLERITIVNDILAGHEKMGNFEMAKLSKDLLFKLNNQLDDLQTEILSR